jgi:1,4-dihydroxy-2-naphthoate octaprenyltransferase
MIASALALWAMARPMILLSVILVYIAGNLIARALGFPLAWQSFAWGLVVLLLMSVSIHDTNEFADYETDALTRPTAFSGGSGALPKGDVPRIVALQAAWVTLVLGLVIAIVGLVVGTMSLAAVLVLVIGAVGGWMYSLPPLALAWRGWGELDNAVLGGIVLPLYGYTVQTGRIDLVVILGCLPFAAFVFVNLLATTWADREADAQVGKFTLATRLSVPRLRLIYAVVVLIGYGMLPALLAGQILPGLVVLSSLPIIPMVIWAALRYTRIHSPHPTVMAMIAMLLVQMAAWVRVGS